MIKTIPLCLLFIFLTTLLAGAASAVSSDEPGAAALKKQVDSLYRAAKYQEAIAVAERLLELTRQTVGAEDLRTATVLDTLGSLYTEAGDFAKAESLLDQALQIISKLGDNEKPDAAGVLAHLAKLDMATGRFIEAEELLKQALQIWQKNFGAEYPETVKSLRDLGAFYVEVGEYAKAEPLLKEALEISRKLFGPEHEETAEGFHTLGMLYLSLGDYSKAEPILLEALTIDRKALGEKHPETLRTLHDVGILYWKLGENKKAEMLLLQSLELKEKVLGPQHPDTATTMEALAWLNIELGKFDDAKALAERRMQAVQSAFQSVLSWMSKRARLAYTKKVDPYSLFAALTGCETDLASAMLRNKGAVLDSIIAEFSDAREGGKPETQQLVERLTNQKRILGQILFQRSNGAEIHQRIDQLEREIEQLERQVANDLGPSRIANRSLTTTVEQVQGALPESSALIDFLQYRHSLGKEQFELRYGAMILLKQGAPRWIPLNSRIDRLIKAYRRIRTGTLDDSEATQSLQALYQALWQPIQGSLPEEIKNVIISPDGQLNFLSFATLLDEDGKFLAEKYLIRYVTSGRDLLRSEQGPSECSVILFANPDFNFNHSAARVVEPSRNEGPSASAGKAPIDLTGFSFEPLPGTQRECDELRGEFKAWGWETKAFTGSTASNKNLWQIQSPSILHIATHSFFQPADESDEPAWLTTGHWSFERSYTDPMFRSALVLAGAQAMIDAATKSEDFSTDDNGIATAEEIGTINLRSTRLVTLSTGHFGGEVIPGEGVLGLDRGFFEAGVQHVLMALSAPDDETTVEFMKDFYDAVHESGDAPLALAQVQRKWLVKLRQEQSVARAATLAGPFVMRSKVR